jgi:hypothetical protein
MKRISRRGSRTGIFNFAVGSLAVLADVAISAQNYTAPVAALQPPSNYQDCVFFTLVGISQADPVVPNNPWCALSRTQTGYSEMYASLLAAKLSGSTVNVVTMSAAGGGGCSGFAGDFAVSGNHARLSAIAAGANG